jgi:hypothetical protein
MSTAAAQLLAAMRKTVTGGHNGGRKPKPTHCRCGKLCKSAKLAAAHCRKPRRKPPQVER